jgi:precorrin-6Y C5,15-methyltransferase (decarboxylating)
MKCSNPIAVQTAAPRRWLFIVGIGEDGAGGLTPVARGLIADAEIVFGGKRHLQLAGNLVRGAARPWPSPFDRAVGEVLDQRGRSVCVLASGDPFFHGVGALLAKHVVPDEMLVVPGPSAFGLAAARLGWALQDTVLLSLHGRPLELIRPHLHPNSRILVLTPDATGAQSLATLLADSGFGKSQLTVLEALGGPRERIRRMRAADFSLADVDALNVVALEIEAAPNARVLARASGLADVLFEHDGQITKREIRAVTLSSLAPRCDELLWDIGAGAGSVAIEWMLADPSLRAVAIEQRPGRAARIRRNAAAFGVPALEVIEGRAPDALAGLPQPHAIFVGGGARFSLDAAIAALRSRGRLVANAVTLQTEALLTARHATLGGELVRIALARADKVGGEIAWRPARPITQWLWTKP